MPFWNNVKSQPKLSFKWIAHISSGAQLEFKTYTVRSFQKPSFAIASSEYIWLNDVGYRPGVLSWNPIEINLTDGEGDEENNTRVLYNMLLGSGYQTDNPRLPYSAIEKEKSSITLGRQVILEQIKENGDPLENWILWNPFLESVNFGQANYAAEEIMTLTLTLRYDYAVWEKLSATTTNY